MGKARDQYSKCGRTIFLFFPHRNFSSCVPCKPFILPLQTLDTDFVMQGNEPQDASPFLPSAASLDWNGFVVIRSAVSADLAEECREYVDDMLEQSLVRERHEGLASGELFGAIAPPVTSTSNFAYGAPVMHRWNVLLDGIGDSQKDPQVEGAGGAGLGKEDADAEGIVEVGGQDLDPWRRDPLAALFNHPSRPLAAAIDDGSSEKIAQAVAADGVKTKNVVGRVLGEVLSASCGGGSIASLLEQVCGCNAELCDLSGLVSDPGSQEQKLHYDTRYSSAAISRSASPPLLSDDEENHNMQCLHDDIAARLPEEDSERERAENSDQAAAEGAGNSQKSIHSPGRSLVIIADFRECFSATHEAAGDCVRRPARRDRGHG